MESVLGPLLRGYLALALGFVVMAGLSCVQVGSALPPSVAVGGSPYTWSDWDGLQTCHPTEGLVQPASVDEVVALVTAAATKGQQVKVVGSGHSFSPITLTDDEHSHGVKQQQQQEEEEQEQEEEDHLHNESLSLSGGSVMLNLDKLSKVVELPSEASLFVTVEAGIRVHVLNEALLEAGFALENTGAIAQQSVAGATQTATHGTGSELGSMAAQIASLDIVLADGQIVTASTSSNAELFAAARVGLGALGVVVRVQLRVVPKFKLRRVAMPYALDQLLLDLPELTQRYQRLQWYYTPYTNNATLLLRLPAPIDTPIEPCWPGLFSSREFVERGASQNVTCVDWSFKALCHEADDATLYTEMEYFVEVANASAFAHEFMDFQFSVRNQSRCATGGTAEIPCSLFTGMRYGMRDDISYLSPMSGRNIAVISNIVLGTSNVTGPPEEFALFGRALEWIGTKYAGRPHWGKMNWATAEDLAPVYPFFESFKEVRAKVDPSGMFLNNYLRRVLGLN